MLSLRLDRKLETELDVFARAKQLSRSAAIKKALVEMLEKEKNGKDPYKLGEDLFGISGSGKRNLSRDYKIILKKKLHAKHAH